MSTIAAEPLHWPARRQKATRSRYRLILSLLPMKPMKHEMRLKKHKRKQLTNYLRERTKKNAANNIGNEVASVVEAESLP